MRALEHAGDLAALLFPTSSVQLPKQWPLISAASVARVGMAAALSNTKVQALWKMGGVRADEQWRGQGSEVTEAGAMVKQSRVRWTRRSEMHDVEVGPEVAVGRVHPIPFLPGLSLRQQQAPLHGLGI